MKNSTKSALLKGAMLLGVGAGVLGVSYQRGKERFLEPMVAPCSAEKMAILKRVDDIVLNRREQIQRWYDRTCEVFSRKLPIRCPDIPEGVFESYRNGKLDRFCATREKYPERAAGSHVLGNDLTPLTGKPTITLFPRLFARAEASGICEVMDTDLHERIHAITGEEHEENSDGSMKIDWIEISGISTRMVCIDALSSDPNATEDERYDTARWKMIGQAKAQESSTPMR